MEIKNTIKGTWVLRKSEAYSPWHVKIVPIFLDFYPDSAKVIVRGYGKVSEEQDTYVVEDNFLRIGDSTRFEIKSVTKFILTLNIAGTEYSYFSLRTDNKVPDLAKLFKILTIKKKWELNGNLLEFTSEESKLTAERSYKAIEHRSGQQFFGTFFLDVYKSNVFLILLVDGRYKEDFFQVLDFGPGRVELKKVDYGKDGITMIISKKE
jgi:hypothetical protein